MLSCLSLLFHNVFGFYVFTFVLPFFRLISRCYKHGMLKVDSQTGIKRSGALSAPIRMSWLWEQASFDKCKWHTTICGFCLGGNAANHRVVFNKGWWWDPLHLNELQFHVLWCYDFVVLFFTWCYCVSYVPYKNKKIWLFRASKRLSNLLLRALDTLWSFIVSSERGESHFIPHC